MGEESRGRNEEAARAGNMVAAIVDCIATCLGLANKLVGVAVAALIESFKTCADFWLMT